MTSISRRDFAAGACAFALFFQCSADAAMAADPATPNMLLVEKSSEKLRIVIDPGHGGIDTGATRGNVKESEIALSIAKEVAKILSDDPRFEVTMTRDRDVALTLPERASVARKAKADIFISIHCNASEDPRAQGVEFFFQNQLPADEEAMFLASRENQNHETEGASQNREDTLSRSDDVARILDDLKRNHRITASRDLSRVLLSHWHSESRRRNRNSIRQAPFFLVSELTVPSVLVELGFISHESEKKRLSNPDHQQMIARNLANGLIEFKKAFDHDRRPQAD